MSKGAIAKKDSNMATYMKKHNIQRTTTQCPFHYGPVSLGSVFINHIRTCKAGLAGRNR
jgi:hypothetical protein